MRVLDVELVTSATDGRGFPRDALPEVAFVGRSNVGKSSLINALTRRRVARTSAAPGKTRLANFFRVRLEPGAHSALRSLRFVDLPGYGYARGGRESARAFDQLTRDYFGASGVSGAGRPGLALLLVDARHPGLRADLGARGWLAGLGVPVAVVATKIDTLSKGARLAVRRELETSLDAPVLPVSAAEGEGLDELWTLIVNHLDPRTASASPTSAT